VFSFDNDSCEFYANFIVRGLTLKGLETDTLYLVFKDRIQFVFMGITLRTAWLCLKQSWILTDGCSGVKRRNEVFQS
ncbi:MAG: hypothetical protein QOH70_995, partial [Blastocatellia bacterium]|nr:hypothetical protein [Blastocatellia bacterium]